MKHLVSAFRMPNLLTLILLGVVVQFFATSTAFALEDQSADNSEAVIALQNETTTNENPTLEDEVASNAAPNKADAADEIHGDSSEDGCLNIDKELSEEPSVGDSAKTDTDAIRIETSDKAPSEEPAIRLEVTDTALSKEPSVDESTKTGTDVIRNEATNKAPSKEPSASESAKTGSDNIQLEATDTDAVLAQQDSKERVAAVADSSKARVTEKVDSKDSKGSENSLTNIYRLYNSNNGEHIFTCSFNEAKTLASIGWQWENVAWVAPTTKEPVYRLYNPNSSDHHYTMNKKEYDWLCTIGWRGEGISWYSDSTKKVPLYRLFNPNEKVGTHHYTTDVNERNYLDRIGWNYEGICWYATEDEPVTIDAQWLLSPASGSQERYWLNPNGSIAKNRLILPEEGTGYMAYAKNNGVVVRGRWDNGAGYVYLANNAGKLATTPDGKTGWLVTSDYDKGSERYYYDANKHAMRTGLLTIDGKQYYGMSGTGRIARNNVISANGKTYYADNDGVLTETHSEHDITLARALAELSTCTNDSMSNEQKLRAAFNHIRDDFGEYNPRIPHMKRLGWETIYANDMFVGRGGNCCSYGAAFAFMAKAIGYSNVYCCNSGGHGWAEVDGRVYDPEWERANRGQSFFSVGYYDNSGVNYKVVLNNSDWMRVAI